MLIFAAVALAVWIPVAIAALWIASRPRRSPAADFDAAVDAALALAALGQAPDRERVVLTEPERAALAEIEWAGLSAGRRTSQH